MKKINEIDQSNVIHVDAIRQLGYEDALVDLEIAQFKSTGRCDDCTEEFKLHPDRNYCPACGSINLLLPISSNL